MPQPLSSISDKVNKSTYLTPTAILERPVQAAKIMAVISIWSHIDHQYANIVTKCLRSDFEIVTEMMNAIISSDARKSVIRKAVESRYPEQLALFDAIGRIIKPSRDKRNNFAHHLWGINPYIPDSVCLVNPKHLTELDAQNEAFWTEFYKDPSSYMNKERPPSFVDQSKIMIYSDKDLEKEIEDASKAAVLSSKLRMCLSDHPASDDLQKELYSMPEVQKILTPNSEYEDIIDN